jgi:hypothetical protein
VGCSGPHGGAALGHMMTSRGLVFRCSRRLSAPFYLGQSRQEAAPHWPYLSAIDPIRANVPPRRHVCRENLDRRQWGARFDKNSPIGRSAHGAKQSFGAFSITFDRRNARCLEEWIRPDSFWRVVRPVTSATAITEAASACSAPVSRATAQHHFHRHIRKRLVARLPGKNQIAHPKLFEVA